MRASTFGNGMVVREEIVGVDDAQRRVAWAIVIAPFVHYSGTAQVLADGHDCRFVWTADLLPKDLASSVEAMMEAGIATIKKTLET